MVVQHNIMALNSHRRLGVNNTAVGKNLEKLSSGYRINRAGDDAAGLAISEKMRAQIKGLEVAQRNAQDGISLVQTAEGALDEVHSMLKRMVELSTQAANGTYDDQSRSELQKEITKLRMVELSTQAANGTYDDQSRSELQKEITKLNEEIDRIAEGTNFNDIKLLNGDLGRGNLPKLTGFEGLDPAKITTTAAVSQAGEITFKTSNALADNDVITSTITFTDDSGKTQKVELKLTFKEDKANQHHKLVTEGGVEIDLGANKTATAANMTDAFKAAAQESTTLTSTFNIADGGAGKLLLTNKKAGTGTQAKVLAVDFTGKTTKPDLDANKVQAADKEMNYNLDAFGKDKVFTVNGHKFAFADSASIKAGKFDADVNLVEVTGANPVAADVAKMANVIANKTGLGSDIIESNATSLIFNSTPDHGGLSLQVGDTGEDFNQLTVSVNNMDSQSLGVKGIDISTITGARSAIDNIKNAINKVSSARSDLGAVQNRLEHTISNLSVAAENMTASESRIRDVDMAKEMMMFTQNNVLSQAAQAMLAQSNQQPQQILQLLR